MELLELLVLILSHVLLEHILGGSFRIFSNFTMLNLELNGPITLINMNNVIDITKCGVCGTCGASFEF